jgi:hypothetical protein
MSGINLHACEEKHSLSGPQKAQPRPEKQKALGRRMKK